MSGKDGNRILSVRFLRRDNSERCETQGHQRRDDDDNDAHHTLRNTSTELPKVKAQLRGESMKTERAGAKVAVVVSAGEAFRAGARNGRDTIVLAGELAGRRKRGN